MATSLKAEDLKAKGNVCFSQGDFVGAEKYYTQAIIRDSTNAPFFTNRALARLKQEHWEGVIQDCHKALDIQPNSLKAFTYLGNANLHLDRPSEALSASLAAYKLALEQRSPSASTIAQAVLAAKKRKWEVSEDKRIETESALLRTLIKSLWESCDYRVLELKRSKERKTDEAFYVERLESDLRLQVDGSGEERHSEWDSHFRDEVEMLRHATQEKIEQLKEVFARADPARFKKRIVPDYFIDPITFSFIHDPVITKNGHSYERATILEHLRRSKTDPLTREPLTEDDLRPNLALKEACDDFLKENGWAVDY